jgi:hypothetical protein
MYSGGAAHETSQAAGKSAPSHNQDQQTKPGAGSGGGWRQAVAQGFILDVVTVSASIRNNPCLVHTCVRMEGQPAAVISGLACMTHYQHHSSGGPQ